jgi:hypothetical protein
MLYKIFNILFQKYGTNERNAIPPDFFRFKVFVYISYETWAAGKVQAFQTLMSSTMRLNRFVFIQEVKRNTFQHGGPEFGFYLQFLDLPGLLNLSQFVFYLR